LVLGLGLASAGVWSATPVAPQTVEAAISAPVSAAASISDPVRITTGFADVVAKVTPAVVTIRVEAKATPQLTQLPQFPEGSPFGDLFGQRGRGGRQIPPQLQRGLGSGVIVTNDGYILTNNHVIDNATKIEVELSDRRIVSGRLIGADPASDLAVVKIDDKNLPVLPIGDSNAMRVGDLVLAIGNPLGVGQTVTMGIVSAKGRATGAGDGSYEDFLQTDAPINQGNSGGALVNTKGELIGINSQILSVSEGNIGIGFAIPANMASHVMDELRTEGRVRRAQLGVTVQPVTSDLAASLGLSETRGAIVSSVESGSAAERAGIKRGDVIVSFNGKAVTEFNALRNRVAETKPGTDAAVGIVRDGSDKTLTVKLDEVSANRSARGSSGRGPQADDKTALGVAVEPLTPEMAARAGVGRGVKGLLVENVDPDGRAADAGIQAGDVIVEANRKAVNSVDDLRTAARSTADKPLLLLVHRQGRELFVTVRAS
jgi:Do/DeqQ family serine protease